MAIPSSPTWRPVALLGVFNRECVALVAGRGFNGEDVGRILSEAGKERREAVPSVVEGS